MSNKVRIYELSRELNLDSKDILAVCEQLNIAAKSHSSTITETDAEQIRQSAQQNTASPSSRTPIAPKHRREDAQRSSPTRASKVIRPRKQQILEVRKRDDSAIAAKDTDSTDSDVRSPQRPTFSTPSVAKPVRPTSPTAASSPASGQRDVDAPAKPRLTPPPKPGEAVAQRPADLTSPSDRLSATEEPTRPESAPSAPSLMGKPVLRRASPEAPPTDSSPEPGVDETDEPTLMVKPQRPKVVRAKSTPDPEESRHGEEADANAGLLPDALLELEQEKSKALKLKRPTPQTLRVG